jgi:hypothetical protein
MTLLYDLFSLVCSQDLSRSYAIAGVVLPFCQRCTGLYLGLGTALVAQLLSGSHRRGLPSGAALYACILSLLIMPAFGFHLLDPGPGWRLWSGLIYGNAIAWLLVPATFTLGPHAGVLRDHTRGSAIAFWVNLVFVITVPIWFPLHSAAFAYSVLALACAGALGAVVCVCACLAFLVQTVLVRIFVKGDLHGSTQS